MSHEDELRQWAKGSRAHEAATELLLRVFAVRYSGPEQPWVLYGVGYLNVWIYFACIRDQIHRLYDRELPVLLLATSRQRACR